MTDIVIGDSSSEPQRRRQPSVEAIVGREAARLVRDLNRQLGRWQALSVKLHTMAGRLKAKRRADPSVVEEAQALFNLVSAEAERFESLVREQSSAVARHGRIGDTRRSFEMVTDRLRAALDLLGVASKVE